MSPGDRERPQHGSGAEPRAHPNRVKELLSSPVWLGLGTIITAAVAVLIYFLSSSASPGPSAPLGGAKAGAGAIPNSGTAAGGALLGSYSFGILPNYTVVLGAAKPGSSDFTPAGAECDSGNLCSWGGFEANTGSTLLSLPGGSTPTFQACENATPAPSEPDTAATAFCISETGLMLGVTITSVGPASPYLTEVHVTAWRNLS